jgi:hypothetical protein
MRKIVYFKKKMLDIPDPDFAKLIFKVNFSIQRSHSGLVEIKACPYIQAF